MNRPSGCSGRQTPAPVHRFCGAVVVSMIFRPGTSDCQKNQDCSDRSHNDEYREATHPIDCREHDPPRFVALVQLLEILRRTTPKVPLTAYWVTGYPVRLRVGPH
jgi:hypothetical protein